MSLFPGLPALPVGFPDLFAGVVALTGDAIGALSGAAPPLWGLFLNGEPVILADNVVTLEYRRDFQISNYPIEQGGFSSYNKVQKPFEVRIRFSTGGSLADRSAFLASIDAVIGDTNLYDVVTPEATYSNVNLVHEDLRRTADDGAGLIKVDVWCEEVRAASLALSSSGSGTQTGTTVTTTAPDGASTTTTTPISNPQSPSAALTTNDGTVQATPPTSAQQAAADSVLAQSMLPF